jgi:hypothetical protein
MPTPRAPIDGGGTTLTFPGLTANVIEIKEDGESVKTIDTTHLGTANYETMIVAKLKSPGKVSAKIEYDPASRPVVGSTGSLVLVYPFTAPVTHTFANTYLVGFNPEAVKQGEKLMASVEFQLNTGPVVS